MTETIIYPNCDPFISRFLAVMYILENVCLESSNFLNHTINWFKLFKSLFGNNKYFY